MLQSSVGAKTEVTWSARATPKELVGLTDESVIELVHKDLNYFIEGADTIIIRSGGEL